MTPQRVLGLITILPAMLALLGAPEVEARRWRCHSDKQCKFGTCNDAGQCCTGFAGQVACGTGCCNTLLGYTCCDSACIDTQTDNNNCGGCGNVCTGGKTCQDGVCTCSPQDTDCDGVCRYLPLDPNNCGACGHKCDEGLDCLLGTCRCPGVGHELCNGQCTDVQTDRNNCGWCGNACLEGQECSAGACEWTTCPPLTKLCGDQCVWGSGDDGGFCCQWQGSWHTCNTGMQCAGDSCCAAETAVCPHPDGNVYCCSPGWVCAPGVGCCDPAPYPECQGWWCCHNYS